MKTINVTQRDIDNGVQCKGGRDCPFTLAARRIFHDVEYSIPSGIFNMIGRRIVALNFIPEVKIFMNAFDRGKPVLPTKFKVEVGNYASTKH